MREWVVEMREWVVEMREWVVEMREWVVEMREWVVEMREWVVVMREWVVEMREWVVEMREWEVEMREWVVDMREWVVEMRERVVEMREWVVEMREWVVEMREWVVEMRVGGGDERVGGGDERVGGGDERVGGGNERVGGGNERVGGGDGVVDMREWVVEMRERVVEMREWVVEMREWVVEMREWVVEMREWVVERVRRAEECGPEGRGQRQCRAAALPMATGWGGGARHEGRGAAREWCCGKCSGVKGKWRLTDRNEGRWKGKAGGGACGGRGEWLVQTLHGGQSLLLPLLHEAKGAAGVCGWCVEWQGQEQWRACAAAKSKGSLATLANGNCCPARTFADWPEGRCTTATPSPSSLSRFPFLPPPPPPHSPSLPPSPSPLPPPPSPLPHPSSPTPPPRPPSPSCHLPWRTASRRSCLCRRRAFVASDRATLLACDEGLRPLSPATGLPCDGTSGAAVGVAERRRLDHEEKWRGGRSRTGR
ncbi:unnamed protein product [Closterium sp. NIES-64]|nr:unnamed protein product [Closterium sp. NIES-64]